MEDEQVGLRHEIAGESIGTCDLCGKADQHLTVIAEAGTAQLGEPDVPQHVCDDCYRQLASGEFPVEPDEFEPSPL